MEQANIHWLIENRIIYVKRPSTVSIENLTQDSEQIIALLEAGNAPIHIINDALDVSMNPNNALLIRKATPFLDNPNLGWFITITANPIISFLGSIIPQMRMNNSSNVKIVKTSDEALKFLRKHDPSINWDTMNESQQIS